jgi:hypothetical protein
MKIKIFASKPMHGGITKPQASSDVGSITVRTYHSNVSKKKMDALEHLHTTREKRYSLQRALQKLKETKGMKERQAEEEQLTKEISMLKSIEMDAELAFKNTK